MFMEVYEGETIEGLVKGQNENSVEEAHCLLSETNKYFRKFMEEKDYKSRLNLEDIRTITVNTGEEKKKFLFENMESYAAEFRKVSMVSKVKTESTVEFNSIISDVLSLKHSILTTSYDKTLRVLDKKFNLRAER